MSARPGKGSPKLDIPLEMVARLEQLVELADRVESKRRTRFKADTLVIPWKTW